MLNPEGIFQLGAAFWGSKALLSAVEFGLFGELARSGPLDVEALRARLGLHPRSARDFFDALVALRMLQRDEAGRYANAPETDLFLDPAKPTYVGALLEMLNARLYRFWGSLTDALRTGAPQNEAKEGGASLFDALAKDPQAARHFLRAMTGVSMGPAHAIAEKFPWARAKSFADVGCAAGCLPVVVARAHPHLEAIGWDMEYARPAFEEYVRANGLEGRVRFVAGDFFKDPLPRADVLVFGHILHDWDLEQKKMLLRKAHEALSAGGSAIVYEALIDDARRENAFGLLMSLNMLIETPGGFDFTGADCRAWLAEAGFRESRVEPLVGPYSMVVGVK